MKFMYKIICQKGEKLLQAAIISVQYEKRVEGNVGQFEWVIGIA